PRPKTIRVLNKPPGLLACSSSDTEALHEQPTSSPCNGFVRRDLALSRRASCPRPHFTRLCCGGTSHHYRSKRGWEDLAAAHPGLRAQAHGWSADGPWREPVA